MLWQNIFDREQNRILKTTNSSCHSISISFDKSSKEYIDDRTQRLKMMTILKLLCRFHGANFFQWVIAFLPLKIFIKNIMNNEFYIICINFFFNLKIHKKLNQINKCSKSIYNASSCRAYKLG